MIIKFAIFENDDALIKILTNCLIKYETTSEMKDICKSLTSLGFIVFNHDYIMNLNYCEFNSYVPAGTASGANIKYSKSFERADFIRSHSRERGDLNTLTYKDFIELKNKKITFIDNPDDPYGEDDWGMTVIEESASDDPLNIKNKVIYFGDDIDSAVILYYKLIEIGYTFWDGDNIGALQSHNWNAFGPFHPNDFVPCLYSKDNLYGRYEKVQIDEILKIMGYNKSIKKTTRPDIDPYDEEDWGVEIIEEKKFQEKELYIRDLLDSLKGLNTDDYSVDFKLAKITNKIRKEIKGHHVRFEDSYGRVIESPVSDVRVRINSETVSAPLYYRDRDTTVVKKVRNVQILFTIPPTLQRRWSSEHELRLPQTIRIFDPPPPKRVYSKLDPYGEEDWSLE